MCGHLFCWPCLHQWLETRPQRQICPVCKAGIGRDKVVPLYGRDGDQKDPREKPIPPRYRFSILYFICLKCKQQNLTKRIEIEVVHTYV